MKARSPDRLGYTWSWRADVALAAVLLLVAVLLVRRVRLSHWGRTLGTVAEPGSSAATSPCPGAQYLAGTVERAAERVPFATKCLPRAVATQWRLRLAGIPSQLVVAFHVIDRQGEDGFHAWVEHGGQMIIGQCDRAAYRPALTIAQGAPPRASGHT